MGVPPFSKEWFDLYLTNCPEPLRPVVERICEGYQLGNSSDPNLVTEMILGGLEEVFDKTYVLDDGATKVTADSLCFSWPGDFYFTTIKGREVGFEEVFGTEEEA